MNAKKISRALMAAALMTMTGMASACHAASPTLPFGQQIRMETAGMAPPKISLPTVSPTVLLDTAMLEEYQGGNPASRITIFRSGASARQTLNSETGKNHS